ncbi:hypothetical protein QFW96_29740 [Saccharopolyspora sp. TS4A08]|uniref:Uncharacterized protein n=1 Tax=Saccharopolyspora ipomoeae TaxID=3042027 RepID=A0ABT6PXU6_9PSEU|nr:hypothetical protein [Saccharopolyspora sp. TS4A08]MDI2032836.1 hypothetical protein [Saccharopolyspora sp. TS4A08]
MRGYPVHLLFHLLAIVAGIACGVAGALWWFNGDRNALYLAATALIVGIIVLLLQVFYIIASEPPPRPRRPMPPAPPSQPRFHPVSEHRVSEQRDPTRPDLEPVAPPESESVDQETKTSALNALDEHTNRS